MSVIYSLLLSIDGIVYDFVCYLYEIFEFLAKINIFGEENYNTIVNRIYIVLGLIMLFALAYSLLKAVINPDSFAKGESSFPKLIQNVVVSLIIIAVLPTVFTVAFNIQNSVLNQDTIPKIILGEEEFSSIENTNPGKSMAYYTFTAFFHENEEWCESPEANINNYNPDDGSTACSDKINGNGWILLQNGPSLTEVTKDVLGTEERPQGYSFWNFNQFSEAVSKGQISYMMIVSTVAGIFLAYVLLNFCFNMATRVIKLMYFQLIAPIPVICRVIPGGKLKDVFSDWTKKTVSTFLEVFIHIGVMYLGVFMINMIIANLGSIGFAPVPANMVNILPSAVNWGGLGLTQRLIVRALLIMGVVTFIKQAPKLICDMFHLDSGSMKLGLMDKLAMGGGLLAAGAVGTLTSLGVGGIRNFAKSRKEGKGILESSLAAVRGGGSSAIRTAFNTRGAKNVKDVMGAVNKGMEAQMANRNDPYRAQRRQQAVKEWFLGTEVDELDEIISKAGRVEKANDVFRDELKKQFNKHSGEAGILYNTDDNFFKGDNANSLFDIYNKYKLIDENGNKKVMALSVIKQDLEARTSELSTKGTDYFIREAQAKIAKPEIEKPVMENFKSSIIGADGNPIIDMNAYNAALGNYNQMMGEYETQLAQAEAEGIKQYYNEQRYVSNLSDMINQLEKRSITELGNIAMNGGSLGTIKTSDFFQAKQLGETAMATFKNSGLSAVDPSNSKAVDFDINEQAKYIDDISSALQNQAVAAATKKQDYLEKKKNN